jgi:hypothetical protein
MPAANAVAGSLSGVHVGSSEVVVGSMRVGSETCGETSVGARRETLHW